MPQMAVQPAIAANKAANTITVRATSSVVQIIEKVIEQNDKPRAEIVIDVEILEVDRARLKEYGLQVATPGSSGLAPGVDINSSNLTLQSLKNLTAADALVSGFPSLYYHLLKTDGNTRTLANPHLRALEGVSATAKLSASRVVRSPARWP